MNIKPGDIVATDYGVYDHWSIVSDRFCDAGKHMLISATRRNGTVKEEPWDIVVDGKETVRVPCKSSIKKKLIVAKARREINIWEYSLLNNNCEHFVNWVVGFGVTSKQVDYAINGALIGCSAVALLSDDISTEKLIGGALLGLAVGSLFGRSKDDIKKQLPNRSAIKLIAE